MWNSGEILKLHNKDLKIPYKMYFMFNSNGELIICHHYGDGVTMFPSYRQEHIILWFSGFEDKNGKEVYEEDVLQLKNCDNEIIKVVCKYGINRREINTNFVDIPSFYFRRSDGLNSYPIVVNYLGIHDLEIMEVIGNNLKSPELLNL